MGILLSSPDKTLELDTLWDPVGNIDKYWILYIINMFSGIKTKCHSDTGPLINMGYWAFGLPTGVPFGRVGRTESTRDGGSRVQGEPLGWNR